MQHEFTSSHKPWEREMMKALTIKEKYDQKSLERQKKNSYQKALRS